MVIEKLGSSLANQGSPIKFLLRFIYLVCIFVCGCVRVCVRTSRSQDNFCSYFSPGDWTQVWKLTSSAFTHWTITGSRMSYKFKIWNLWAPCFSQSWVLESQAYATIPNVYLHTADYSQKTCRLPHTCVCKHIRTHASTCTQSLLLPQSVIIPLPWFLFRLSGPVHNHPLLNECWMDNFH